MQVPDQNLSNRLINKNYFLFLRNLNELARKTRTIPYESIRQAHCHIVTGFLECGVVFPASRKGIQCKVKSAKQVNGKWKLQKNVAFGTELFLDRETDSIVAETK